MIRIHFLNVGHGDCTIIKHHSGRLTMIDINNSQEYDQDSFNDFMREQSKPINALAAAFGGDMPRPAIDYAPAISNALLGILPTQNTLSNALARSSSQKSVLDELLERIEAGNKAKKELTNPVDFLQKTYPGENIWRFILTHPDLDHMRGIKNLYDKIGFANFWDTNHTKPSPAFRNDDDKIDWEFYQKLRTNGDNYNRRLYMRGDSLYAFAKDEYGQPGGDNIEILSPTPDLVRDCNVIEDSNNISLVLRVKHAGRSVLLPGDAEDDAWEIMTDFYGRALKSDVLKASHHGRDTGYNLNAIQLISPILTIVSVGRKPDTDASSKYSQQSERVASTRYHGNIEIQISDYGQITWFVDRNPG